MFVEGDLTEGDLETFNFKWFLCQIKYILC